jgi:hypothetical protein
MKKSDATIDSVYYKEVEYILDSAYRLPNIDKNTNGAYVWSCGHFYNPG